VLHRTGASCVTRVFLDLLDSPELGKGDAARVLRGHPGSDVLGHLALDVVPKLIVHRPFDRRPSKEQPQPAPPAPALRPHGAATTRSTAPENKRHTSISAESWRRPAAVRR